MFIMHTCTTVNAAVDVQLLHLCYERLRGGRARERVNHRAQAGHARQRRFRQRGG